MKQLILLFAACLMAMSGMAQKTTNLVLEGNIGPYAVTMVLNDNPTRGKHQSYVGYYYYNRNPKNRFKLYLVGLKRCSEAELEESGGDDCQRIRLQEHSTSGNITGEFRGLDEQGLIHRISHGQYKKMDENFEDSRKLVTFCTSARYR